MIIPRTPQRSGDVAGHYDELDPVYRALWGTHVHHGLWTRGRETPEQAVEALSMRVAEAIGLRSGMRLCDIGCGYGATARLFARTADVHVTGMTLSARQAEHAVSLAPPDGSVQVLCGDWLANALPDAAFHAAYAIESSEHMEDKARFFAEAGRVLRPGGRLAVCAWLAADDPSRWQIDHLLEPICREGRLPGMGTRADYEALATAAGFRAIAYEDLSRRVRRTWTICTRRFLGKLVADPAYRRLVASPLTRNRTFALSLPRLILAYRTGAMRYGLLLWEKG